jgi:zinc protease
VVVAVGDLEPEQAVDVLEPLLAWGVTAGPTARDAAPAWHAGRGAERRQREQSALAMAFPSARFASDDRYGVTVLGSLLSGLAGRLFDELREKRSLAYTVAAMPWLARRAGAVLCYIATSPEREEEARAAMLAELRRVVTEPPDDAELSRARNYAAGLVEVRRQTGRALAAEILEAWVHGALDAFPGLADRLRAVSQDEVLRAGDALGEHEGRAEYVVRGGGNG